MKILSVNTFLDDTVGGGAEKTRETLLQALKNAGHDVVGVGTSAESGMEPYESGGIRRWRVGLWNIYWPRTNFTQPIWKRRIWHLIDIYNSGMKRRLSHVLDVEKPDAVILHNLPGWSISVISAIRKRKIPIIQVLHDHYNICPNMMMFKNYRNCVAQCADCHVMRLPHRRITNHVDAVVGVSRYILDRHLAHGAYTKVKLKTVIHNVRSAEALGLAEAPELRKRAATERGDIKVRFGFIGTLAATKGIEYLLAVFVRLGIPGTELWVAGRGKPEYEEMLKARFNATNVRFLGQMTPKHFFTAIDVAIVPSLWQENFPGVVLESFAFGVPVIGSLRGGIPEMIIDGETGWLFEPDEIGSLEILLRRVAADALSLQRMSRRALQEGAAFLETGAWQSEYCLTIERAAMSNLSTPETQRPPIAYR